MSCYCESSPVYVKPMQRLCSLETYKRKSGRAFKKYHGYSLGVRYWWANNGMTTRVSLRGAIPNKGSMGSDLARKMFSLYQDMAASVEEEE